jgi:hypothetical protein
MSRKRQRMEQFGEAPKLKRQQRPPEVWTRKDKLVVCGAFTAGFIALFGGPILKSVITHRQIVNRRLAAWEARFQLSNEEVERLRETEFRVHGSGLQFASKTRSHEQNQAHKQELSQAMSPNAAQEFLKYYEMKKPCAR